MIKLYLACLLGILLHASVMAVSINQDDKRAQEIRQTMWKSGDKDFDETKIPDKWKGSSAVIIAKSKRLYYRKPPMASKLNYFNHSHERIKLLDNAALEQYAQFSIPSNGTLGNTAYEFYAGFKIIKPDGQTIEIPIDQAVKESMKVNNTGFDIYKLAIPNLELGDILDYYLCEEQTINIYSKYYSFDPVIFQLHDDDYPIVKQKISFDVLRRCFINLKTLNGAPEFNLAENAEDDRNHYYLEDGDRESITKCEWLYPFRELPTIKFKVVYASNMAANVIPGFIGEPGIIKSFVTSSEIKKLMSYLLNESNLSANTTYLTLKKEMKTRYKKEKNKITLAKNAFYLVRNKERIAYAEKRLLSGEETNPNESFFTTLAALNRFYRDKDIDHDILIGIPRHISSLDNLILENELIFSIRVNAPEPFYISKIDNNATPGLPDADLQGATVYKAKGNFPPLMWTLSEEKIPVIPAAENSTNTSCSISITDLNEGTAKAHLVKTVKGEGKELYQHLLLDYYDYKDEEKKRYGVIEDFENMSKSFAKKLLAKRVDYLAQRNNTKLETLKKIISNDYDLTIEKVENMTINETGRFDENPLFHYEYDVNFSGLLRKAGRNYILDLGKLIEKQVHLDQEDRDRKYNIYEPYARSFKYTLMVEIPEGYAVEGLEKLETNIENSTGGFTCKPNVADGKLVVETFKYYASNYEKKEDWSKMIEFLDEAYNFNQKQILLKKN